MSNKSSQSGNFYTGTAHDDKTSDADARRRLGDNIEKKELPPVNESMHALQRRFSQLGKSKARRGKRSPEEIRRKAILNKAVSILKKEKAVSRETAIKQQDLADRLGIPRRGAGNYLAFAVAYGMMLSIRRAADFNKSGTDAVYYYLP